MPHWIRPEIHPEPTLAPTAVTSTPQARAAPAQAHVDTTLVSLSPISQRQGLFQRPNCDALCSF